jgi:hypothetical protein
MKEADEATPQIEAWIAQDDVPFTMSEVAAAADELPRPRVERIIKALVASGKLVAIGQKRGRKYRLADACEGLPS